MRKSFLIKKYKLLLSNIKQILLQILGLVVFSQFTNVQSVNMNLTLTLVTIFILRNSLVKGDAEQNENHKWRGQWIKGSRNFQEDIIKKLKSEDSQVIKNRPGLKPVLYFRKTFFSDKCVKKGTVYITSKGVFKG